MAEDSKGEFIKQLEDLTGYVVATAKYGLTLVAVGGGFFVSVTDSSVTVFLVCDELDCSNIIDWEYFVEPDKELSSFSFEGTEIVGGFEINSFEGSTLAILPVSISPADLYGTVL